MHDIDFLSVQKQTGIRDVPRAVIEEYERVVNMVSRDSVQLPLGPRAINDILRRCGLEGPTAARPSEFVITDWRNVKPKTRILVRYNGKGEPRRGIMLQHKSNGCLDVLFDDDAVVREFAQRHCTLDNHYSDDPWASVTKGRMVSVLRGRREFDAKFVAVEDASSLRVAFKGGEKVVPRANVKLTEGAAA